VQTWRSRWSEDAFLTDRWGMLRHCLERNHAGAQQPAPFRCDEDSKRRGFEFRSSVYTAEIVERPHCIGNRHLREAQPFDYVLLTHRVPVLAFEQISGQEHQKLRV